MQPNFDLLVFQLNLQFGLQMFCLMLDTLQIAGRHIKRFWYSWLCRPHSLIQRQVLALACWDVINVINLVSSLLSNLARHSSLGSKQTCLYLRLITNNSGKAERYAIHDQLFGFRLSFKLLHKHSVLGVK